MSWKSCVTIFCLWIALTSVNSYGFVRNENKKISGSGNFHALPKAISGQQSNQNMAVVPQTSSQQNQTDNTAKYNLPNKTDNANETMPTYIHNEATHENISQSTLNKLKLIEKTFKYDRELLIRHLEKQIALRREAQLGSEHSKALGSDTLTDNNTSISQNLNPNDPQRIKPVEQTTTSTTKALVRSTRSLTKEKQSTMSEELLIQQIDLKLAKMLNNEQTPLADNNLKTQTVKQLEHMPEPTNKLSLKASEQTLVPNVQASAQTQTSYVKASAETPTPNEISLTMVNRLSDLSSKQNDVTKIKQNLPLSTTHNDIRTEHNIQGHMHIQPQVQSVSLLNSQPSPPQYTPQSHNPTYEVVSLNNQQRFRTDFNILEPKPQFQEYTNIHPVQQLGQTFNPGNIPTALELQNQNGMEIHPHQTVHHLAQNMNPLQINNRVELQNPQINRDVFAINSHQMGQNLGQIYNPTLMQNSLQLQNQPLIKEHVAANSHSTGQQLFNNAQIRQPVQQNVFMPFDAMPFYTMLQDGGMLPVRTLQINDLSGSNKGSDAGLSQSTKPTVPTTETYTTTPAPRKTSAPKAQPVLSDVTTTGEADMQRIYFEKAMHKQDLEIQKLELEIRALKRAENSPPPKEIEIETKMAKNPVNNTPAAATTTMANPFLDFGKKHMKFPFDF